MLLGVFEIGCTRSANLKGSIALNPFDRAGTTIKRVFYWRKFMTKHTPGPWVVEGWDVREPDGCVINSGLQVVAIKNGAKCPIYAATEDGDGDEMEANLDLMAASPQLLIALEDAEKVLRGIAEQVPSVKSRCDAYAALIAKAKGGAA